MLRIGLLDLGTVSLRFEIYDVDEGRYPADPVHSIKRQVKERKMLRLGEGLYETGKLSVPGKEKAREALARARTAFRDAGVQVVCAAATSAFREAIDGKELIAELENELRCEIEIITGEEEAKLTARGILVFEDVPAGAFALVDIGGGSTEITLCSNRHLEKSLSLPLGAIRGQDMFLKTSPPAREGVTAYRAHVRKTLLSSPLAAESLSYPLVIGSSASMRTLSKLAYGDLAIETGIVARSRVSEIVQILLPLATADIAGIPGMEANRADIILSGAVLFEELMIFLNAAELKPTLFSLRHGLLDRKVREIIGLS